MEKFLTRVIFPVLAKLAISILLKILNINILQRMLSG